MDRLHALLASLTELDPDLGLRKTWTEKKLVAFEKEVGRPLPPELRGFLSSIGEGAGFWTGSMVPLAKQNRGHLARAKKPFPLRKGFVPSSEVEALKEAGIYRRYQKYVYPLPAGTRATDGTLVVGIDEAGQRYRVVLDGPLADSVWTDNQGNDFQEVMPTGSRFLDLFEKWLTTALASAKKMARTAIALTKGSKEKKPAVSRAAAEKYFKELREQQAEEGATPLARNVALAMFEHYAPKDPESAGQALLLAEDWEKLRAFSQECLDQGRYGIPFRGPTTHAVHLALANARLGRTERPAYTEPVAYYHYYGGTVAASLARWPGDALARVLGLLPEELATEILEELSEATLTRHGKALKAPIAALKKRLAEQR